MSNSIRDSIFGSEPNNIPTTSVNNSIRDSIFGAPEESITPKETNSIRNSIF